MNMELLPPFFLLLPKHHRSLSDAGWNVSRLSLFRFQFLLAVSHGCSFEIQTFLDFWTVCWNKNVRVRMATGTRCDSLSTFVKRSQNRIAI